MSESKLGQEGSVQKVQRAPEEREGQRVRDGQDNCGVQSREGQGQRRACWRKGLTWCSAGNDTGNKDQLLTHAGFPQHRGEGTGPWGSQALGEAVPTELPGLN